MIERLDGVEPKVVRLAAYCALILVTAALVSRSLVPLVKSYQQSAHTKSVLSQVVNNQGGVADEIASVRREVDALRKQVAGDMASLPQREMESFVVDRLQAISWRNGVELGALKPAAGIDTSHYSEMLFQIELAGGYFQLVDWLRDLADELGFVVVKEQQLALKQSGGLKPVLTTRLSLAAYRLAGVE